MVEVEGISPQAKEVTYQVEAVAGTEADAEVEMVEQRGEAEERDHVDAEAEAAEADVDAEVEMVEQRGEAEERDHVDAEAEVETSPQAKEGVGAAAGNAVVVRKEMNHPHQMSSYSI